MVYDRWKINGYDRDDAVRLTDSGINPLIAVILASRGVTDAERAGRFLDTGLTAVLDPFGMQGMEAAAARVRRAIDEREHVVVFGDYDVDGMTASCLLAGFLRKKGLDCEIYIPCRLEEGYGVNSNAIDDFARRGVSLVITVDCGVTANEEAAHAAALGIDMIITDHHECRDELPDAVAVVDPKRRDCTYVNKSLAGVGVAFKLVCAVEGQDRLEELLDEFGDLLAIGTIADVVPVTGENRAFIRYGLEAVEKRKRPGLLHLLRECGLEGRPLNTGNVGFALAPRINAAGRMGRTVLSTDLLMTDDPAEAERLAAELCELNMERRSLVTDIYDEALEMLEKEPADGPIVLAKEGWFQGVVGIVAARLAERFCVPAILISLDGDGFGRGSCRSYGGFRLYPALEHCSGLLDNYGGHEMAAGLTVAEENVPAFRKALCEYYRENVTTPPVPTLNIDLEVIKPALLSFRNVSALALLEPYGNGHPSPSLCIMDASLASVTAIGGGSHVKLRIAFGGETFECIFFSHSPESLGVTVGDRVDIAFSPQINDFRGRQSIQLMLIDIRPHTGGGE